MKIALAFLALAASLSAQHNTLTEKEAQEGWVLLWDGRTDFGWEYHGDAVWTTQDGVLAARSGKNGWLGTTTAFGDFHLTLDFRCAADCNSGVFLRSAREGEPHRTGYELQMYDAQPQGFNTGSLVFYQKASPAKIIPDDWNHYDILVDGMSYKIVLNGKLVLETTNPTHLSGVIGLQYNENKPIEFRNMKLRPLNLKPLFNGKDLAGWKEVDRPAKPGNDQWSVRDGVLHVEGGPGQVETEQQFRNLALQLAIKTNPASPGAHPNSGVFLRGYPGGFWTGYEIQIRNEFKGDAANVVDFGTGGVYFFQKARSIVPKDGAWFYETILAYDRHISVWVDGQQVSDYEDVKPEGANHRKQANLRSGTISLQAHDPTTNLDFREIRAAEVATRPIRLQ